MFETSTRRISRQIRARSIEETTFSHFIFEYTIEQNMLYSELCDAAAKALDLTYNQDSEKLLLTAKIGNEDQFVISGDAQLRDVLLSTRADEEIELIVARRRKSMASSINSKKSIMVNVFLSLGDDPNVSQDSASIRFSWLGATEDAANSSNENRNSLAEGMLLDLKDELLDALDQFGQEAAAFALHFKLDGDWIPIAGDRVVFDVLSTLNAAGSTSVEARLSQTPPKAPTTNIKLRCIFEGVTRETKDDIEIADDATKLLSLLTSSCKSLWGAVDNGDNDSSSSSGAPLSPDDEVTIFNAVPPTDFKTAALDSERAAQAVVRAARKSHEKTVLLRMERGSVLPQHQAVVGPTQVQTLYYDNETSRFEQEADFPFSWPAHGNGSFAALGERVRSLLHLTVPFDMFLGTDPRGDIPPQHIKTDDHVRTFLVNAPARTQLFCIKSSLDAGNSTSMTAAGAMGGSMAVGCSSVGPLPVGRASYIRALVEDWKQILPRSNRSGTSSGMAGPPLLTETPEEEQAEEDRRRQPVRITADEMRPVIATWHCTWELHRRELQLVDELEAFASSGPSPSVAVEELFSLLMRWTAYLVEDEVASFARHGQSMVDYLTEVSNEARCMRLSAKIFSSLRQGNNRADPGIVVKALVASGTVARPDADSVVAQYDSNGIEQWELDEILTYFFLDDSSAFARLLAATSAMRTTPDYSHHDTQMRAVREKRYRSELRHALDGIVPAHLVKFAKDHFGLTPSQVPPPYQELAWCVATLLGHSSGKETGADDAESFKTPRMRAWKWLVGECSVESAAADLLAALRTTGLSYCSDDRLQEVGVLVYNDCIDARLLHTKAGAFFSNLAQWCYLLQDLTFLVRGLQLKVAAAATSSSSESVPTEEKKDEEEPTAADVAPAAAQEGEEGAQKQEEETATATATAVDASPAPAAAAREIIVEEEEEEASSSSRGQSPTRVRYSPPRATIALRRPQPPSAGSPASVRGQHQQHASTARSISNTTRAIVPSGSAALTSAGFGLTARRPEQDLNALLREQKEEHLIRDFAGGDATPSSTAAGGDNNNNTNNSPSSGGSMPRTKNNAEYALISIKGAAGLVKHPMLHSVDSYVVAYNSGGVVVHQTPVMEGTCSPRFPAQSRFVVPLTTSANSRDLGSVVFHVLTESNVAGFLGEATLKLAEATVGGTRDVVLRIKPRRGETDELLLEHALDLGHLTVELVPMKQPIFLPRGEPGFVVCGAVECASNLPPLQSAGERRDMYVQIMDGNNCPVRRTEPAVNRAKPDGEGAVNPVWAGLAAEFVVPLENVALPSTASGPGGVKFQLIDEDLRGGRIYGNATLLPNMLVDQKQQEQQQQQKEGQYKLQVLVDPIVSHQLIIPHDCALTVTARVLGPLPDDVAHRKRQEEARRLAQQRAEELAEDKRRRDAEEEDRVRDNEEYIAAAEREAERQRAEHASKVKQQADERAQMDSKQRDAEAQAKAKIAAMAAAAQEEDDEHSQRRKQQKEMAAKAEEAERERMSTIDREMQRAISEEEMKERIKKQLEEEDEARRKHEQDGTTPAGDNNNSRSGEHNNNNDEASAEDENAEPKTQQEVAEHAAKDEMRRLREQQEAEERAERDAAARLSVEKEESDDVRPLVEQEYEQWVIGADKQMIQDRLEVEEIERKRAEVSRAADEREQREFDKAAATSAAGDEADAAEKAEAAPAVDPAAAAEEEEEL